MNGLERLIGLGGRLTDHELNSFQDLTEDYVDRKVARLTSLSRLHLRAFDKGKAARQMSDLDFASLARLSNLQELDISQHLSTTPAVVGLLAQLPSLRILSLSCACGASAGVGARAASSSSSSSSSSSTSSAAVLCTLLEALQGLPSLEEVAVRHVSRQDVESPEVKQAIEGLWRSSKRLAGLSLYPCMYPVAAAARGGAASSSPAASTTALGRARQQQAMSMGPCCEYKDAVHWCSF